MGRKLELILFGNLEIRLAGELLTEFKSKKAQALLCYLAVTGQPHRRSALANLLWSNKPEAAARMNLSQALSELRRFFGDYLNISIWMSIDLKKR
jgi:DNA-binding SARP family transcriptional activator